MHTITIKVIICNRPCANRPNPSFGREVLLLRYQDSEGDLITFDMDKVCVTKHVQTCTRVAPTITIRLSLKAYMKAQGVPPSSVKTQAESSGQLYSDAAPEPHSVLHTSLMWVALFCGLPCSVGYAVVWVWVLHS